MVARAHARRAHEPLGPHLAAQRPVRLQAAARRDGLGFDWPIDYEDVAPYYDKVEMLIGVYGDNEAWRTRPIRPPGCLLPPPKPRAGELLIAEAREEARHARHRRCTAPC